METVSSARLRASEVISQLYIDRASTDFERAELARAAGLSERTLYRYFPTKQDCVRPVLDHGSAILARTIAEREDLPLIEAIVTGFEEAVGGQYAERTRGLFPLLLADAALRAVLLQALHECEQSIRPSLARRLRVAPRSLDAMVAASSTVAMIRVALEMLSVEGREPVATLRDGLHALGDYRPAD